MAPIRFGFLLYPYQLIDMAGPMDIIASASKSNLNHYNAQLAEQGLDIEFYHVGATKDPVETTGGCVLLPTATYASCPKLDYLLIGGPDPAFAANLPVEMADFIRSQAANCKTVFATCTGALTLAATGLLDGVDATVNHEAVEVGRNMFPKVKWTDQLNWVVAEDGKFWTSSGAVAGMDMVAEWVKLQVGDEVLRSAQKMLSYDRRDVHGKLVAA